MEVFDQIKETLTPFIEAISSVILKTFPLLDTLVIIAAGCFGLLIFGKIRPHLRSMVVQALGVLVLLIGISEAWDALFVMQDGQFEAEGTLLVGISLLIGYLFGSALSMESLLGKLGGLLHRLFMGTSAPAPAPKGGKTPVKPANGTKVSSKASDGAKTPVKATEAGLTSEAAASPQPANTISRAYDPLGFLIGTVVCAFGASAIRCAIDGPLLDDVKSLSIKLALDAVIIFVLAAVYGSSAIFVSIPVLVVEGGITLLAHFKGDWLTTVLQDQLFMVGAVILIASGICLCFKKHFKAANFLPALLIPPLYAFVMTQVDKLVERMEEKK